MIIHAFFTPYPKFTANIGMMTAAIIPKILKTTNIITRFLTQLLTPPIIASDDDISADRLKNAAATKKLAIFDAFEILNRIQEEENLLEGKETKTEVKVFKGFAEGRSR